jgi:uncharacterized phiE125 gp8 family phage protein
MPAVLLKPPAFEPLDVEDAKIHLRIGHSAEDELIAVLVEAARLHVECAFGLALVAQRWMLRLDRWPSCPAIDLPVWPVLGVETVQVIGEEGDAFVIDAAHYVLDASARPARLLRRPGRCWPNPGMARSGIEIGFIAGFGERGGDVPQPIRQALRHLVAHLYENRDGLESVSPGAEPAIVASLLSPYRLHHL